MDIQELRSRIDRVDDELVRLYGERMELAREIGRYTAVSRGKTAFPYSIRNGKGNC